jgi:hypothetical protein
MAKSIRERLAALAQPLGITLPEEYVTFVENPPARGILVHHLSAKGDPPYEWWPETIEGLEADVYGGHMKETLPCAHEISATAQEFLTGGCKSVPGPGGTEFRTDRLARAFWIGEDDGDGVFIDAETGGVFVYMMHEECVERWAASFAEFVAKGQEGKGRG